MRIWIVNHYALPPGSSGGPTRHLGLSRALRDRGHEVVIHASIFDHYTRRDHRPRADGPAIEDIDGVTYVWWPTPPYDGLRGRIDNMIRFWWAVSRHAHTVPLSAPDAVLGSSPHLLSPLAARRLARHFRVPFVMEVRDLWPQSLIDLGDFGPHHPAMAVLGFLEKRLYATADQVVTVLPGAIDHMVARGADPTRIRYVPNGVDLSRWPSVVAPPGASPMVALYAGTLGHANGLEVVVDAARELERRGCTSVTIRLVGAGPEREALTSRAAGCPLISIEDPVSEAEVPALVAASDVCLLVLRDSPVFRFGISPTKLFDAFAAGRPVVTSVRTEPNPVALADAGRCAIPGDPVSLADELEAMAALPPDERRQMGSRGRRFVEGQHSFERLAEDIEGVLFDARKVLHS